jgi:uncharacterized membrane protein (DUF106 family)
MNFASETVQLAVVGGVVSVVTALFTAIVTYALGRGKTKADMQSTLSAGFQTLITEMQDETATLRELVQKQSLEVRDLQRRVDQLIFTAHTFHNFILANNLIPPNVDFGEGWGRPAPAGPNQ